MSKLDFETPEEKLIRLFEEEIQYAKETTPTYINGVIFAWPSILYQILSLVKNLFQERNEWLDLGMKYQKTSQSTINRLLMAILNGDISINEHKRKRKNG